MADETLFIKKSTLTSIADAVRTKGGTTESLSVPDGIVEAIDAIPSGGNEELLDSIIGRTATDLMSNCSIVGPYAFYNYSELRSVDIPMATKLYGSAFYKTIGLEKVNAPNATYISDMCFWMSGVKELILGDMARIRDMGCSHCEHLTKVTFKSIEQLDKEAFSWCSNLTEIKLPGIKLIGYQAFRGTPLKDIWLPSSILCAADRDISISGKIHVPAPLIEQYKVAPNWSDYASQFVAIE